ncbi:MAG: PDC sensor domain-containing protein [Pseudomonadota bacterium]
MPSLLEKTIASQRKMLVDLMFQPLADISIKLSPFINSREKLEQSLQDACHVFKYCKYIYVLNEKCIQLTATLNNNNDGGEVEHLGRNRSGRPYMQNDFEENHFFLSEAYISKRKKRPSITAVHSICDEDGKLIGFLGVDYDLRELPSSDELYPEKLQWRQIKGDPAIRSGLFLQERVQSRMDNNIENILALMEALIIEHGVFHGKFHFSSSRTTIWLVDDPYHYRLLTMPELDDPDICLVYPRRRYFERAIVPPEKIKVIFDYFRRLRFADETIYLRAGSINIVNGMVSLNFSCDGSHYLPYDEFLNKGMDFWFGASGEPQSTSIDTVLESICAKGCNYVYEVIEQVENNHSPIQLLSLSIDDQLQILKELKCIMKVYE